MHIPNKKETLILLLGDIIAFAASLWLSLSLRNGTLPSKDVYLNNFEPFAILGVAWIISFYIAGLYEKQRINERRKLPELIIKTQLFNSVVAIAFFYFIPYLGVTPKTILFLYIIISLALSFMWRIYALRFFGSKKKDKAFLIAEGKEADELYKEINQNPRYSFQIVSEIHTGALSNIDFNKDILEPIYEDDISIIIIDSRNEKVSPILPHLYNLIFSKVQFVDLYSFYEEIFDRVPVSLLRYSWFLENISLAPHFFYDFLKRFMDISVSFVLAFVSLVFYPFVYIAIKLEDNGPIFIKQERIGKNNRKINIIKFRSMSRNDEGEYDSNGQMVENKVTKVGKFLRKSRIDEFPQLWNVLAGDLSLIGPRPELPKIMEEYTKAIPYYGVRHIIKPGLSGWAQLYHETHPHHGIDIKETQNKLSYDLFYIKYRSLPLDIIIALKTIKTLLSRQGI